MIIIINYYKNGGGVGIGKYFFMIDHSIICFKFLVKRCH